LGAERSFGKGNSFSLMLNCKKRFNKWRRTRAEIIKKKKKNPVRLKSIKKFKGPEGKQKEWKQATS
jgi:hypothetical protein